MKRLAIVIPVRNRQKITCSMLSFLRQQISNITEIVVSIIVVDDGSTDATAEIVASQFPEVILLKGDGALWWTGAVCLGMKYALENLEPDYFLWLNDDSELDQSFMQNIVHLVQNASNADSMIAGIVCDQNHPNWVVFGGFYRHKPLRDIAVFGHHESIEVDAVSGNITLIPRAVVDAIGLPDRQRFVHYGDHEYGVRARKAGFKLVLTQALKGTTVWTPQDCVRYMPLFLQWHLTKSWQNRLAILRQLTSIRSNFNVWLRINLLDIEAKQAPLLRSPRCVIYYLRQVSKLLLSDWLYRTRAEQELAVYLQEHNIPPAIAEAIRRQSAV